MDSAQHIGTPRRRCRPQAASKRRLFLVLSVCAIFGRALRADEPEIAPVVVDYFYEPGCPDCLRVRDIVLPQLKERFDGLYMLNRYDVGVKSNVFLLIRYQTALAIHENKPVCMVVDYGRALNGFSAIERGLLASVEECVAERLTGEWKPPAPILGARNPDIQLLEQRMKGFTLPAVLGAGLIDGINPCAISTLVFFVSLLSVAGIRGRGLLLMGASFCLASFLTYTALGFGLLRILHVCRGFPAAQHAVEMLMIVALAALAFLSFRDARRFRIYGNAKAITLQLPPAIKRRIHAVTRTGLAVRHLLLGGLFVGVSVTALESVCTGQVYVPTLVLLLKSRRSVPAAAGYLLLYNSMFIAPLVIVFALSYRGLRAEKLIGWSKKNVVLSKISLGSLFLVLAALILVL